MEIKESKKIVKDNIRAYKIERDSDIYYSNDLGILLQTYQLFAPSIAVAIESNAIISSCAFAFVTVFNMRYLNEIMSHPLNKEIMYLRSIENELNNGDNILSHIGKNEFQKQLVKRKTYLC